MQKLQTVNAETLLYEPLEKPSFVVDSLIPTGLSLFCGSQKIGKSWLMLKLCLCVSQGIPLWDIGKQQAYIDSLKERIGQESDYAGRMRDEKYEQELKVQKANQKIFELQRTNEQMGRLLSKIPPEVLEELQKNHRSRAKER